MEKTNEASNETLRKPKIGTLVELKKETLGSEPGDVGVCYHVYDMYGNEEDTTYMVLLENGESCGFSKDEFYDYFDILRDTNFNYKFTNALMLQVNWREGHFNKWFLMAHTAQGAKRAYVTVEDIDGLSKAISKCEADNAQSFTYHGMTLDLAYAKYLVEYLQLMQSKKGEVK